MSKRKLMLSGEEFTYVLTKKKVKNINIRIGADQIIKVSCPHYTTIKEIEKCLISNEEFIRNSISEIKDKVESEGKLEYINGEKIDILGEKKTLCILPGRRNTANIKGTDINLLCVDANDRKMIEKTFGKMIEKLAKERIGKIIDEVYPLFAETVKKMPEIRYKRMISQWGNCAPKKNMMSFSIYLVHTPVQCIRYVVIHEFTHFIQFNHSKAFYREVENLMPDYQIWRNKLKEYGKYMKKQAEQQH